MGTENRILKKVVVFDEFDDDMNNIVFDLYLFVQNLNQLIQD